MNTFFAICLFLTFKFVDGNEISFPVDELVVGVENNSLQVKSSDLYVSMPINELASMRFTDSAVEITGIKKSAPIEVFSIKGESIGSFESVNELKKSIPGGTYILRQGKNSIKISI